MSSIEKLKQKIHSDKEFGKLFTNVYGLDEAIAIAKENGFDITEEDIANDEALTDELLEAVAGGKNKKDTTIVNDIYFK